MIDATRIEQPEVERPDLYVYVHEVRLRQRRDWAINGPFPDSSKPDHGAVGMRLPGTRREKLTKALMEALAEWHRTRILSDDSPDKANQQLFAAFADFLALDAEGVKG